MDPADAGTLAAASVSFLTSLLSAVYAAGSRKAAREQTAPAELREDATRARQEVSALREELQRTSAQNAERDRAMHLSLDRHEARLHELADRLGRTVTEDVFAVYNGTTREQLNDLTKVAHELRGLLRHGPNRD